MCDLLSTILKKSIALKTWNACERAMCAKDDSCWILYLKAFRI